MRDIFADKGWGDHPGCRADWEAVEEVTGTLPCGKEQERWSGVSGAGTGWSGYFCRSLVVPGGGASRETECWFGG